MIKNIIILFSILITQIGILQSFDDIGAIGGRSNDISLSMALDSTDAIIMIGNTLSSNYPVTDNAYQRFLTSGDRVKQDGFVTKFDDSFNLVFSTYFGSAEEDYIVDVETGPDNTIWIVGHTKYSVSFPYSPVTAYDSIHNGGFDIFLSNFSSDGTTLLYSTLIGGAGDDFATSLAISPDGEIAVGGYSKGVGLSEYYPTTGDALLKQPLSQTDGIISVFRRDGTLRYSTFTGGNSPDYVQDLAYLPGSANVGQLAVLIYTRSQGIQMPADAYDSSFNNIGDNTIGDVLIQILDLTNGLLDKTTYLGGSGDDLPYTIDVSENILISGATSSRNFPTTSLTFDATFNGPATVEAANIDGFIAELDYDLNNLEYSTYLGGNSTDRIYSISRDKRGLIYFAGLSSSVNFPVSGNAYRSANTTKFPDIVTGRLSRSGRRLGYSSLLGGDGSDISYSINTDTRNRQVIAGFTNSSDIPFEGIEPFTSLSTPDTNDVLLTRYTFPPFSDSYEICPGDSVVIFVDHELSGNVTYDWFPKTNILNPDTEEPTVFPDTTTEYTAIIRSGTQSVSKQIMVNVNSLPQPIISGPSLAYQDSTYTYAIQNISEINPQNSSDFGFLWNVVGGTILGNDDLPEIRVRWDDLSIAAINVLVASPKGCAAFSNDLNVGLDPTRILPVVPFGDYDLCEGDTIVMDGGADYYDFAWNTGNRTRFDTISREGIFNFTAKRVSDNSNYSSPNAFVNIIDRSAKPIVRKQGNLLRCLFAATTFQWFRNGLPIPGATEAIYEYPPPVELSCYRIRVTIENGCAAFSDEICLEPVSVQSLPEGLSINHDRLNSQIKVLSDTQKIIATKIYELNGRLVSDDSNYLENHIIDVSQLRPSVYFLYLDYNNQPLVYKFVITD